VASAAPTIVALETDSAWIVVVAVSAVTLATALVLRRAIGRAGGLGAGVLMALPLFLPIVAALAFEHAVLPEIAVLRPVGAALRERPHHFLHVLLVSDGTSEHVTPYAFSGSAGPWLLIMGVAASSVMLLRRLAGTVLVHRLVTHCRPLGTSGREAHVSNSVQSLARAAGIRTPQVKILPPGLSGAFVVGARRPTILVAEELLDYLDAHELEAVLAHEIAHLEARDVPMVFGAGMLRDVVAWNPVAHLAFRWLLSDRELAADRRAAALTGRPLALASGLIKMWELLRLDRRGVPRASLALMRSSGRVSRRVTQLLAVADGRVEPGGTGRLPHLVAACVVAVLGLQAGARLAHDASAVAIVVGSTTVSERGLWAPKQERTKALLKSRPDTASRATNRPSPRPPRYPELLQGVVKEKDLPEWINILSKLSDRLNISPTTLRWQARAVPIFDRAGGVGPITILRMESQLASR
jgi:Zn-dependent protease with chaperone function